MANITATQKKAPVHQHVASDITNLDVVLGDYQEKLVAGSNIQIAADGKTISATDTTYSAGDFDIKDLADSTNKRSTWDAKQDAIIAGSNIQIAADGKTISATDTTYDASDFDIKDLADSTNLKDEWSGKQDELIAGSNIQIAADGKTISATDTTYNVLSDSDLETGTSTVSKVVTAKVIADYVKGKIASTYNVKGSKTDYSDLPSSGNVKGDVWNIINEFTLDGKKYPAGTNVVWTGSEWDPLGGTVDLSVFYTKTNINTMSGLNDAIAGFSAVDIAVDSTTKQASATDHTDDQTINGAQDKNVAAIKAIMNAYNALETRVDTAETGISNVYTKTNINTITGLNSASAGFSSTALSVNSTTKQMSATDTTDSQSIDAAQDANVTAFKAIKDAYNALETRVDSLEQGNDEVSRFYQITFSGTAHTYSDSFITADSFVQYNFASDPAGYVEFTVQSGKIGITSSATESDLVIKVLVQKNPGTFTTLEADA